MFRQVFFSLVIFFGHASVHAEPVAELKSLQPFLQSHCVSCHEGVDSSGQLDISRLSHDLDDAESMRRWILIYDRLASGEMPPKDQPQPTSAEKTQVLTALKTELTRADKARSDVVLRRLNRNEYENTIRDLFDVHVRVKEILPEDTPSSGFDNVGEGLAVSAEAAQAYILAADVALDAVFGDAKNQSTSNMRRTYSTRRHSTANLSWKSKLGKCFVVPKTGW